MGCNLSAICLKDNKPCYDCEPCIFCEIPRRKAFIMTDEKYCDSCPNFGGVKMLYRCGAPLEDGEISSDESDEEFSSDDLVGLDRRSSLASSDRGLLANGTCGCFVTNVQDRCEYHKGCKLVVSEYQYCAKTVFKYSAFNKRE